MWEIPSNLSFQTDDLHKSLGAWGGMAIIAIGPRGGKIVGYGSGGKPIYAGSTQAKELVSQRTARKHVQTTAQKHGAVYDWLVGIGFPNKIVEDEVLVTPESGKLLMDSYGTKPIHTGSMHWKFNLDALNKFVGQPLTPHGAEKVVWAAKAASGDLENDPFPADLGKLKEIPAGAAAGSHGNKLFQSPDGHKWLFKTHDDVIARAEEAASRLGRLVFGPDRFAAARYVKLGGKDGVLLEWKEGEEIPQPSTHQTSSSFLEKYAPQFLEHQVFDWLVSNHDSHAGNFLVHDGKLLAIDKGQAWRFFGKDKLAADYSPNPSKPVYNKLWAMWQGGALPQSKPELVAAVARTLERIEKITPEQFEEIVKPYAITRAKKTGENVQSLLTDLLNRRNDLRADWTEFLSTVFDETKAQISIWMENTPKEPGKDNFETMPDVESEPKPKPEPKPEPEDQTPTQKALAVQKAHRDWEKQVNVGDEVQVRWTNIGMYPQGSGKVVKINEKSLLVELAAPVKLGDITWSSGQKIKVPRHSTSLDWSWSNTIFPMGVKLGKETKPEDFFAPVSAVKPVFEEPSKPLAIEGGAKAPIVEKPAPGWPQTKGKVTVSHPGNPPAAGSKWPEGYPGPGFQVSVDYKGKHYDIEFETTPSGGFKAKVYYPDGSSNFYDSPNKASDSLYLHAKGLPLDMSATEKKKQGISYPASKAFGIQAFQKELAEAKGGITTNDMTVKELESAGVVQKDTATVPAELKGLSVEAAKMMGVAEPAPTKGFDTADLSYQEIKGKLYEYKAGTVLTIGGVKFTRTDHETWGAGPGSKHAGKFLSDSFLANHIKEQAPQWISATPSPGEKPSVPNWETMPETTDTKVPAGLDHLDLVGFLTKAPTGSSVYVHGFGIFTKSPEGTKWIDENGKAGGSATVADVLHDHGGIATKATVLPPKKTPSLPNWETMPPGEAQDIPAEGWDQDSMVAWLNAAPTNSQLYIEAADAIYSKTPAGTWKGPSGNENPAAGLTAGLHAKGGKVYVETTPKAPAAGPSPEPPKMAEGAVHTVQKPGLGTINLQKTAEGYSVGFDFKGSMKSQTFKTISGAAKFAFIHQKGFETEADYKKATGKSAPGVSWGFFGIKPEAAPKAPAAPKPAPAPAPAEEPAGTLLGGPVTAELAKKWPIGTELSWHSPTGTGLVYAKKTESPSTWEVKYPDKEAVSIYSTPGGITAAATSALDNEVWLLAAKKPGAPNWETMPAPASVMSLLNDFTPGTRIKFDRGASTIHAIRETTNEGWRLTDEDGKPMGSPVKPEILMKLVEGMKPGTFQKLAPEAAPVPALAPGGSKLPIEAGDMEVGTLDALPAGAQLSWKSHSDMPVSVTKLESGAWDYKIGDMDPIPALPADHVVTKFKSFAQHNTIAGKLPATSTGPTDLGWTVLPDKPQSYEVQKMPVNTHYQVTMGSHTQFWKHGPFGWEMWTGDKWKQEALMDLLTAMDAADKIQTTFFEVPGQTVGESAETPPPGVAATGAKSTSPDNWDWFKEHPTDTLPLAYGTPAEFIDTAPLGATIQVSDKSDPKQYTVYSKLGADNWAGLSNTGTKVEASDSDWKQWLADKTEFEINTLIASFPKVTKKAKKPAKPIATVLQPNVKVMKDQMPKGTHAKMDVLVPAATDWSTQLPEKDGVTVGQTPVGAKPTTWAPWVPPPGVLIEATLGEKKYWFTTAVVGHNNTTGEPWPQVSLALLDEEGTIYSGKKYSGKTAIKSLEDALVKAGISMSPEQIKEAFGLSKLKFAPGETYLSVKDGTGPSAIPNAPEAKEVSNKVQTVQALQKALVKVTQPLSEALDLDQYALDHGVKVKPGDKTFDLVVDGYDGAAAALDHLVQKYGLGDVIVKQKTLSPTQAFVSIPTWALNQDVVAVTTHYEVISKPKPVGADNFETMPEGVPQVIKSNTTAATISKILEAVPVDTSFLTAKGTLYAKKKDGWYNIETGSKMPDNPTHLFEGVTTSVIPPGVEKPEFVEPKFAPKVEWSKTAEMVAKVEKAKAVADWAKKNGPVTDANALRVLAYLQKAAPEGMKFWVRTAKDGELLIGSEHPDFKKFWMDLGIPPEHYESAKTPLGTFKKVPPEVLAAHVPGAGFITGPDGKPYPMGTTFTSKQVDTTIKDRIEQLPGFYKWSDHKDDPSLQVMKVKGTGPEQIEAAKKIALTMGLTIPEPKVGGSNVLAFFKKEDLAKVAFTETITTPEIPPQPPTFSPTGLPIGSTVLGTVAPVNRQDLGAAAGLTMGQTGYAIRMGKHGIFRDNQVFCRRVKDADGKVWIDVFGALEQQDLVPKSLTSGSHTFRDTANTKVPGYEYDQQTYDAAGDFQVETSGKAKVYTANVGKTKAGSSISVINDKSERSIVGNFVVRIAADADIEKEMAEAVDAMGLDVQAAMAEPDADDVRKATKLAFVRAIKGPTAFGTGISYENAINEKWLDKQLVGHEDKVASAEWQWVGPGKQAPVVNDSEAIKEAGVAFLFINASGVGSIASRLREGFMSSNKRKYQNGVVGNSASASHDMEVGGGNSVFMRLGNKDASGSWGYKQHGVRLIFHPRLLNRLDWYAHSGDSYGSVTSGTNSRYDSLGYAEANNEVMFQDTVSLRDLAGIHVNDADERDKLISLTKQMGLPQEVNGIPLDKFIVVSGSSSRKEIAKQTVGLQEGVLP